MAKKTPTIEIYSNNRSYEGEFFPNGRVNAETAVTMFFVSPNADKRKNEKWYDWLFKPDNAYFRVVLGDDLSNKAFTFSAQKRIVRGMAYWYAMKRVNKVLETIYIGETFTLTPARLNEIGRKFETMSMSEVN